MAWHQHGTFVLVPVTIFAGVGWVLSLIGDMNVVTLWMT